MEKSFDGVINIHKEKGYTSHDVVAIVRKTLGRVKAGHTGTLDPNATGVLPVCVGKATKIASFLTADVKEYRAEVVLGVATDSEDLTGAVIEQSAVNFDAEQIKNVVQGFVGEYLQTPPMYSAIKVNGKKLYELARKGEVVNREPRLMHIHSINIVATDVQTNTFVMDVVCSKGTYIRTLCVDIGKKLSVPACMGELTRARSGSFLIDKSITLEQLKQIVARGQAETVITKMEDAVLEIGKAYALEACHKKLYNGNVLSVSDVKSEDLEKGFDKLFVHDKNNVLIGIYEVRKEEGLLKPLAVFYTAADFY